MTGVDDRVANNTEGERSNSGLSPFCACFSEWSKVPFLLGVIVHATYIVLRMSSETRWTWYYTSWILLGAVLLARAGFVVLAPRRWLVTPTAAVLVLLLAGGWVKLSYKRSYLGASLRPLQSFIDAVSRKTGIHNAFVFDEPGYVAYYSDLKIIPLDGVVEVG